MDMPKFEDLWKLMNSFNFITDYDSTQEDFSCFLCHKLMIDASQTSCGCQFCYNCISRYLVDGGKYCPGGKPECCEEYMVLERDVFRNNRMNTKIFKLRVHCPNDKCPVTMELSLVGDHLLKCDKQCADCPYVMIGCNDGWSPKDEIGVHLNNYSVAHSNLLMEHLQGLKSQLGRLNEDTELNKLERSFIKEEIRKIETRLMKAIDNMREENNEHNREANIHTNVNRMEIENQRMETIQIKEDLRNKNNRIEALENELLQMRNEMEERILLVTREIERRDGAFEAQRKDFEAVRNEMDNICNIVNERRETKERRHEKKDRRFNNWTRLNKLLPILDVDFVWKIEDMTLNKRALQCRDIASEPFWSRNYKFCLRQISVVDNLGLYCRIMVGENDDNLLWPMRRNVTIGIVDQVSFKTYKSVTYRYDTYQHKDAFHRPINDQCDGIGEWPFILFSTIKDIRTVVINDSIIISCTIGDPH